MHPSAASALGRRGRERLHDARSMPRELERMMLGVPLRRPDASPVFCAALVEIFAETYPNKGGACADYIPQLAVVLGSCTAG